MHITEERSSLAHKLTRSKTIAFLDLDRTVSSPSTNQGLQNLARREIRSLLNQHDAITVFTTARTPELVMSSNRYIASAAFGFPRLPALQGHNPDGTRKFLPLETLEEFDGVLDPDVIHSFGCGIFPWNGSAYVPDATFNDRNPSSWRATMMEMLTALEARHGNVLRYLGPIETAYEYHQSTADVMPLPFRIQFDFRGERGEAEKIALKALIANAMNESPRFRGKATIVDESRPDDKKFCFYLIGRRMTKESALTHIVRSLAREAEVPETELRLFVAGDAFTDLKCLYAGPNCDFWYCLPSEAPVMTALCSGNPQSSFAGESLTRFIRRFRDNEKLPAGHRSFKPPYRRTRRLVVGDLASRGVGPAWSVLHALDAFLSEGIHRPS